MPPKKGPIPKTTMPTGQRKIDEFLKPKSIEDFIKDYPQYNEKVSDVLVKQVLTGDLSPNEFNELKRKYNLGKDIKKYAFLLTPNRFKRITQKIFLL